jgi:pimeloyl-ACP methyl ester carboxylesterase
MPDITYRAEELTESDLYLKVSGWVTNALQATYANKVNLIGHSTGGLVARYYAGASSTVAKVISVGTPHLGLTDFYALAFEQSTKERAERILKVPGTDLENLIRWFEPQYPEGSCLVNADTGEPMPELYESTFHPASNSDVDYYSIYANNRDTPHRLWVRQRNNGWYKIVDPPTGVAATCLGDGYVRAVSSSAGGGPLLIPAAGKNDAKPHPTLCEDPWVQEKILELLRR